MDPVTQRTFDSAEVRKGLLDLAKHLQRAANSSCRPLCEMQVQCYNNINTPVNFIIQSHVLETYLRLGTLPFYEESCAEKSQHESNCTLNKEVLRSQGLAELVQSFFISISDFSANEYMC